MPRSESIRFQMKKTDDGKATVHILDDIGPSWLGMVGSKQFAADLDGLGDVTEISVVMNSVGGDVFEGQTIYSLLSKHPARVIVDVEGAALSIASIIAMAGDEIRMAEGAWMMIHNPWGVAVGDAADLRKTADLMDGVKESLVGIYAARTGIDAKQLSKWMDKETWFNAAEAKEAGLATSVTANKAIAAKFDAQARGFRNCPAALLAAMEKPADRTASAAFDAMLAAQEERVRAELDGGGTVERPKLAWAKSLRVGVA